MFNKIMTLLIVFLCSSCYTAYNGTDDGFNFQPQAPNSGAVPFDPSSQPRQQSISPQPPSQPLATAPDYYQYPPAYQPSGSKAYTNPYSSPPQNVYPYYDSDQYYIPPSNQRNAPSGAASP
jgi:hypothetical protein